MSFSNNELKNNKKEISRRRVISIVGAAVGLSVSNFSFSSSSLAKEQASMFTWEGYALGAQSKIQLAHYTREEAEKIINLAVREIRRLEKIFSLEMIDSEISVLNREGILTKPSYDMLSLLTQAKRYSEISDGAFDITVQPLWNLYSEFFTQNSSSKLGPSSSDINKALKLINFRLIDINPLFVKLEKGGMQITLNGIAQGYITDSVSNILRENGLSNVLVSLGETRALDDHPDGRPWIIDLKDPLSLKGVARTINLNNMAVATSGGYGTKFDLDGNFHHLFDPQTGVSAWSHIGVSVISATATAADALSTALYIAPLTRTEKIIQRTNGVTAILTKSDGTEYAVKS